MDKLDRDQQRAQKQADDWNSKYNFPSPVILTDDDGVKHETRTRSVAWAVCGSAVILVEGRTGGYSLDRIKPVEKSEISELKLNPEKTMKEVMETARASVAVLLPDTEIKFVGYSFHFMAAGTMSTINGWTEGFNPDDYEQ